MKTDKIPDEMLDYTFPSVYLKNITNVLSSYGTSISVGKNINGNHIIKLSSLDTSVQFVAEATAPDKSVFKISR